MNTLARNRRRPAALFVLLLIGLLVTGGVYATANTATEAKSASEDATLVAQGKRLFLEGCSSCHGVQGQGTVTGPSLIGVGAAAVHFQMATGRMPLAAPAIQAPGKMPEFDAEEIEAIGAYIASLAPGPAVPTQAELDYFDADLAYGGELFRVNCSQCHQAAARGGALSNGRYAPDLMPATPQIMFEAMLTGPQNMPVFEDTTLPVEDKQAIIKYIRAMQDNEDPGGWGLGRFGPVTEGLFLFIVGIPVAIACAIWIGAKIR